MSRRAPNAAQDRAAQNQQTIKNLLKLEGNKTCADCKRNKHPRWASWNLGVFVCIRCSGIHRGMGTHVSRVKSVDLDAWTDEQLQSVLKWGNTRANKYWEAKLAPGHVPAETKIENFIRTKYDSKRWVMDGGMPDPSTLRDEADDDVPLGVVQHQQKLQRAASNRASSTSGQPQISNSKIAQNIDLFGDEPPVAPRPSTTEPAVNRQPPPPKAPSTAAPKQGKQGDSLLGLDFFGPSNGQAAAPGRPASVQSPGSSGPSRPDLKQSILSLYASAPKQQTASQPDHSRKDSFSGFQSPPPSSAQSQTSFGGLNDAFGGLTFSNPSSPPPQSQQPSQQAQAAQRPSGPPSFNSFSGSKSSPAEAKVSSPSGAGGAFFNPSTKPAQQPRPSVNQPQKQPSFNAHADFGAFTSAFTSPSSSTANKPSQSSDLNDLFSSPSPPTVPASAQKPVSPPSQASVFNLSAPAPAPAPSKNPPPVRAPTTSSSNQASGAAGAGWGNPDVWGASDVWGAPDPVPAPAEQKAPSPERPRVQSNAGDNDFGWGSPAAATTGPVTKSTMDDFGDFAESSGGFAPSTKSAAPKVTPDEDFGGWDSAPAPAPAPAPMKMPADPTPKPASQAPPPISGSEDLFSNVWE